MTKHYYRNYSVQENAITYISIVVKKLGSSLEIQSLHYGNAQRQKRVVKLAKCDLFEQGGKYPTTEYCWNTKSNKK